MRRALSALRPAGYAATCLAWRALDGLGIRTSKSPPVAMVIERADWAIRWYGTFIVDEVNKLKPGTAAVTVDPAPLLRRIVQFGSQYQWVAWHRYLAPSNRFVVSFMHGKPEDGPEIARHIDAFLRSVPRLSRIVCPAGIVVERLVGWGVPRDLIRHIPIGVETGVFMPPTPEQRRAARARFGIAEHQICIGSFQKDGVGWGDGMEPKLIKGPDLFLDAIARLKDRIPVFVLLTGPARGFVKKGLAAMGVPYAHTYAESRAQLASCYHPLDLYLVTSREEGGPMAMMESMASGVPVVSTRVGMAPDLIEDGRSGALVPVEDMAALAQRALELLERPDLDVLRARAREAVKAADWSVVGRRHLEDVYEPLL